MSSYLHHALSKDHRYSIHSGANLPIFRLLANELAHQLFALFALNVDDLDATLLEVLLATDKSLVLAKDDAVDLVEDACARAHVAG